MTDAEIAALVTKSVEEQTSAKVAPVQKALDDANRTIAVLKMSPKHKAFYDGLKDEGAKKAFADMKDDDKEAECEKMAKAADTVTNADLAKRDADFADLRKRNDDLQKRLDAADLKEAQADFAKRAAKQGLTQPGDGELMRKAFSGDKEAQTAFEKRQSEVVEGLQKQVETGALFSEFGSAKAVTGSAYESLMAKAAELRKTEAGKGLTEAQAFTKVYEDAANRELVQLHKRETQATAN